MSLCLFIGSQSGTCQPSLLSRLIFLITVHFGIPMVSNHSLVQKHTHRSTQEGSTSWY